MKKFFYLMSAAVALLGMVACDKSEIEEPKTPAVEKSNFVLYADIAADARTTLDGKKVDWADGDMLYLVTSDATWGQPYVSSSETNAHTIAQYKYTDGAFVDNSDAELPALTNGTEYTVYAMYTPGQMSYHRAAASTHLLSATQMQDCTDPTAHIAANDAMVGKFTVTPPATSASVSMSHLYTMMEVDVKNNSGADLTITQFEMEAANAELAGTFTVGFANTPIDITNSKNATNKICVKVANGMVAAGASLPIYFVMAPLANYSGDVTFTVTDSNGYTYTKTVALTNKSFEAGKYNKTSYAISEGVAPTDYSGTYVIMQAGSNDNYYYISASNGSSANNRKAVDTAVTTIPASLNSIPSMSNAARWIIAKVDGEQTYTMQSADSEQYITGASSSSNYATMGTADNAEKVEIEYNEDSQTYTIVSAAVGKALSLNESYGIYAFYTTSYAHDLCLVPATEALLDMSVAEDVALTADAANGTVDVVLANNEGWTVAVSNNSGGWLTTENALNGSNQIVYSATANTGDAREAVVSVTATKGTESKTITFTVSQDKKAVADAKVLTFTLTRTANPNLAQTTGNASATSYTYTLDGVDYTFTTTKNGSGIYQNADYMMLCDSEFLGLPAITGYKLTEIETTTRSGASTSVKVGVRDAASTDGNIVADYQQWNNGLTYTYTISGAANTVYYLNATNKKNAQICSLKLTYEPVQ